MINNISFLGDLQSIISKNVAINNKPVESVTEDEGPTWLPMCLQRGYISNDMSNLSTFEQMTWKWVPSTSNKLLEINSLEAI
jgi:hypothetical protein